MRIAYKRAKEKNINFMLFFERWFLPVHRDYYLKVLYYYLLLTSHLEESAGTMPGRPGVQGSSRQQEIADVVSVQLRSCLLGTVSQCSEPTGKLG